MKDVETVYIGIDLHSKTSTIGYMNQDGKYIGHRQVQTTATNLINQVAAIPGQVKKLTLEQSNMAFWAANVLQDYVDELIVCDPRENALISRSHNKNDRLDTLRLCKLLRLGELTAVWRPKQLGIRRLFYGQLKEYQRLIKTLSIHKRQLGDMLRHWGINRKLTSTDYKHPGQLLNQVEDPLLEEEISEKMGFICTIEAQKERQKERFQQTGKQFWEINEFRKISGIGPVGAHTFSAYIQTPHRFRRAGQLIKFCSLAVRKFTSDGRAVRSERLSKAGHGCLKNLAHIAWKSSMGSANEVSRYYQACLEQSGNEVHARLATQRKILITMWALWRKEERYDPAKLTYNYNGGSDR